MHLFNLKNVTPSYRAPGPAPCGVDDGNGGVYAFRLVAIIGLWFYALSLG